MAKKKSLFGVKIVYEKKYKGTSIGSRPNTGSMNKSKKKGRTRKQIRQSLNRGQGR